MMPPEIRALIDKPLSLIAVLFVGALFGAVVEKHLANERRKAWKAKNNWRWATKGGGGKVAAGPWSPSL